MGIINPTHSTSFKSSGLYDSGTEFKRWWTSSPAVFSTSILPVTMVWLIGRSYKSPRLGCFPPRKFPGISCRVVDSLHGLQRRFMWWCNPYFPTATVPGLIRHSGLISPSTPSSLLVRISCLECGSVFGCCYAVFGSATGSPFDSNGLCF